MARDDSYFSKTVGLSSRQADSYLHSSPPPAASELHKVVRLYVGRMPYEIWREGRTLWMYCRPDGSWHRLELGTKPNHKCEGQIRYIVPIRALAAIPGLIEHLTDFDLFLGFKKNSKTEHILLNRLVMATAGHPVGYSFSMKADEKLVVHHRNARSDDDRYENLQVMTHAEHEQHHARVYQHSSLPILQDIVEVTFDSIWLGPERRGTSERWPSWWGRMDAIPLLMENDPSIEPPVAVNGVPAGDLLLFNRYWVEREDGGWGWFDLTSAISSDQYARERLADARYVERLGYDYVASSLLENQPKILRVLLPVGAVPAYEVATIPEELLPAIIRRPEIAGMLSSSSKGTHGRNIPNRTLVNLHVSDLYLESMSPPRTLVLTEIEKTLVAMTVEADRAASARGPLPSPEPPPHPCCWSYIANTTCNPASARCARLHAASPSRERGPPRSLGKSQRLLHVAF